MPSRVLLAGLFHETHTFLPDVTPLADFTVRRGAELLAAEGDASPLAGALQVAREAGWQVMPVIDLRATPSGIVSDEVVALWKAEMTSALRAAQTTGLDGVYLVLHGAMVSQSSLDVEGELLEWLKGQLGDADIPVGGVFDLHANFSQRMATYSHGLVAYRHNPHTDAHEAAVDAARLLDRLMRTGQRPTTLWRQAPVVWPPAGTATADLPMRHLEAEARRIEREITGALAVNVCGGFAHADTPDTGVCLTAVALPQDVKAIEAELDALRRWTIDNRQVGAITQPPLDEVWDKLPPPAPGPIILVEPADNIGGGAPGDATGILRAFIERKVGPAAVVIADAAAVRAVADMQPGQKRRLSLGGRSGPMSGGPVEAEFEFVSRTDGRFTLEDPHSHLASMSGMNIDMGPSAVVRCGAVSVLLTSRPTPPFDLGQLRSQGIIPEEQAIIGVKAAVAHRRAYDPITRATFSVETPGPASSDLLKFPYRHIRRPVHPLDNLE